MQENTAIRNPSGEDWYVEQYALQDQEIGWHQVGDLTENEQKSLVYYLLNNLEGMVEENTLDEIIRHKPGLLEYYRPALLADVGQLEELGLTDLRDRWWNIAKGATEQEVDRLVAQSDDYPEAVVALLGGADTDYALEQLAGLAQGVESIIRQAADMNILITEDGRYERRYLSDAYTLFKTEADETPAPLPDGLSLLEASESAVEKGTVPTCSNKILPLLNVDTEKISPFKGSALEKIGPYHFFSSNCEGCDTWLYSLAFEMSRDQPWKFLGTFYHSEEKQRIERDFDSESPDCDPDSAPPLDEDVPASMLYVPETVSRKSYSRIATLGGRPFWVQSPEIPDCPECGKMMFYVGQNQASEWSGSIGDQVVFGFACEDCMQAIGVMQCT